MICTPQNVIGYWDSYRLFSTIKIYTSFGYPNPYAPANDPWSYSL